ncbi:MAG TPA: ribosomal protein S18-alanine N-acetyltransferase [Geobacteraceae bacterium]|nr:ribosomal protein S18-alanine N-acetyltransferase [Geobacteraceae bacterium]
MQSEITFRTMTATDLEEVLAIENDSFPHPWNRDHFLDELKSVHAFPLVALDPGKRIIGYICPRLILDEGQILNVAVLRAFRGQSIGRILLERVLADCRERGGSTVSLEVRPSNHAAIALYQGLGFVATGIRRNYYENGEDAILMEYIFADNEVDDAV